MSEIIQLARWFGDIKTKPGTTLITNLVGLLLPQLRLFRSLLLEEPVDAPATQEKDSDDEYCNGITKALSDEGYEAPNYLFIGLV